ncbi:thrombospondin type-1 domain-containing protein 7B, partial [Clarias magur]
LGAEGKQKYWTMILKDGLGTMCWPGRAGKLLFLSVSLVVLQADGTSSKNAHYSWKS